MITVGAADGCQVTCVTWCSDAIFVTGVCVCVTWCCCQRCVCVICVLSRRLWHTFPVSLSRALLSLPECVRAQRQGLGRWGGAEGMRSAGGTRLAATRPMPYHPLAFTRCMAHDGMDGWCAGGIDGRIRLWDILQVSSPVGGRCECRVRRVGCVKHDMRCRERNCNAVLTTQLAPARFDTWHASANSTRAHTARVASFHASAEWAQRMGNERHVAPRSQCAPQHRVAFTEHGWSAGARRRRSDSVSWAAVYCGDAG